jgi:polygalacturonase
MAYQIYSNSVPTLSNLTVNTTYSGAGLYQVTGTGGSGGYTLATGSTNGTWASVVNSGTTTPSIQVKGDAEFEGNVTINGQNLAETLQRIQDRLAILVPNPKLLDKYEALRQAYEHYKLLEALCVEQYNPDN